jgi:hypothetical protein
VWEEYQQCRKEAKAAYNSCENEKSKDLQDCLFDCSLPLPSPVKKPWASWVMDHTYQGLCEVRCRNDAKNTFCRMPECCAPGSYYDRYSHCEDSMPPFDPSVVNPCEGY